MVYAISSGEAIHDPGPVTMGLMEDLGWPRATTPPAVTEFLYADFAVDGLYSIIALPGPGSLPSIRRPRRRPVRSRMRTLPVMASIPGSGTAWSVYQFRSWRHLVSQHSGGLRGIWPLFIMVALPGAYINYVHPGKQGAASGSTCFADFAGYGLDSFDGTTQRAINVVHPIRMAAPVRHCTRISLGIPSPHPDGTAWTLINKCSSGKHGGAPGRHCMRTSLDMASIHGTARRGRISTRLPTRHSWLASNSTFYVYFCGVCPLFIQCDQNLRLVTAHPVLMAAGF